MRCWPKSWNFFLIEIWTSYFKSSFRINFRLWEVVKWKLHKYASCLFSVWPLPKVDIFFRKQICNEKVHISILNFFWRFLVNILKSKKNGFLTAFSKSDSTWVEFFLQKKSKKAKHPGICPSFGGNMPEAQFWQVTFKDPP